MNDQTTSITAAATASSDTPTLEASLRQRRLALSLISTCHTLNHLQYSITSVIFPVMMKELGFGLLQLGALSAISNFVGQGLQVIYGLITGFFKRSVILGTGNVIVGVSAISQFFVGNYSQLLVARVAIDAGSSPQHPLGASILARFFPKARGWALTFHHSAGSFGSFIGPGLASIALLYMGWQTAFVVFGIPSLVMGLTLFLVREHASAADETRDRKGNFKANIDAYRACLKNRNILFTSLVLMVGAAGRGSGINLTYLVPFFMERFAVSASVGGLFLTLLQGAGLVGPLAIAWISDRFARRATVTQITLLLSAIMTVWLAYQTSLGLLFYLNLILYGSVVEARSSLTQTMISDFARDELTDAAFSIYYFVGCISGPIWTLVVGYVMQNYGFTPAFLLAASTYLAGMLLLTFVKEDSRTIQLA
jgi:MFS transporter, ACS family, aldohexuronate transporter